jgi:hypothetical protein
MSLYDLPQRTEDRLAIERWLDEGGRAAPDALIERERVGRQRLTPEARTRSANRKPGRQATVVGTTV